MCCRGEAKVDLQAKRGEQNETRLRTVLAVLALCLAAAALIGRFLNLSMLTSVFPNYATMKPSTALCLVLIAAGALWSGSGAPVSALRRSWSFLLEGTALLISAATLIEYLTFRDFGIDQLLHAVPSQRFADPAGRMAFGTAVCLILTSGALLVLDKLPRLSVGLTLSGLAISVFGIVGFVLNAGPLSDVIWLRSLAVHTAAALLLLQIATLASRPCREPFRTLI